MVFKAIGVIVVFVILVVGLTVTMNYLLKRDSKSASSEGEDRNESRDDS